MSHENNRSSHASSLPVPSPFPWKPPLLPVLVVAAAILLALVLWTLPNWTVFSSTFVHWYALWQVSGNRLPIILLIIKVASPVLLALLISACFWLWYSLKPFLLKEEEIPLETAQLEQQRVASTSTEQDQQASLPVEQSTTRQSEQIMLTPAMPSLSATSVAQEQQSEGREEEDHVPGSVARKKLSPHAATLLQRRRQRLYGHAVRIGGHASPSTNPSTASVDRPVDTITSEAPPPSRPSPLITITLLKEVTVTLHAPGGIKRLVPLTLNAKRVQLMAYIAWMRGETLKRDRMLEQLFGHGRSDEEATPEKLGEAFDSHKKLLRMDIRQAIASLNAEVGQEVIPPDFDLFEHKRQLWWLSPLCRVTDLEKVEAEHQIIEEARKNGTLVNGVPEAVKAACDRLMAAYSGDFLEDIIRNYFDEFEPWVNSWARKPYTLYRDYYLQALWYAAEYEWGLGQQVADENSHKADEASQNRKREHWGRAAQLYRTYAMSACNNRFDTKVTFGTGSREQGERVIMSERALRRAIVLYGAIGSTHLVDEAYSAYSRHMRHISGKMWEPGKETLADVQAAKEQTGTYRFVVQFAAHDLPSQQTGSHDPI
jgi:hypothetical protein